MKTLSFIFVLLSFTYGHTTTEGPMSKERPKFDLEHGDVKLLCSRGGLQDASFAKRHKLKNGTMLFVCGSGDNSHLLSAHLWLAGPKKQPRESGVYISDVGE